MQSCLAKPFAELTAADLMSNRSRGPLQAHVVARGGASAVGGPCFRKPVVDDTGCCVGVLSSTDFVRWTAAESGALRRLKPGGPACAPEWQIAEPDALPLDEVSAYMSSCPVFAALDSTVTELRGPWDAHIHRLLVVDAAGRPAGIVSSTDILAAVAQGD